MVEMLQQAAAAMTTKAGEAPTKLAGILANQYMQPPPANTWPRC
jgi:hypothetical protein